MAKKEEEKLRSEMKQFFVCCLQHRYLFLLLLPLDKPFALTITRKCKTCTRKKKLSRTLEYALRI